MHLAGKRGNQETTEVLPEADISLHSKLVFWRSIQWLQKLPYNREHRKHGIKQEKRRAKMTLIKTKHQDGKPDLGQNKLDRVQGNQPGNELPGLCQASKTPSTNSTPQHVIEHSSQSCKLTNIMGPRVTTRWPKLMTLDNLRNVSLGTGNQICRNQATNDASLVGQTKHQPPKDPSRKPTVSSFTRKGFTHPWL